MMYNSVDIIIKDSQQIIGKLFCFLPYFRQQNQSEHYYKHIMNNLQSIKQVEERPSEEKTNNPYQLQTQYSFASLETALRNNFNILSIELIKNSSIMDRLVDRITNLERKQMLTPKQSKIQTISYQYNPSSLLEQKEFDKSRTNSEMKKNHQKQRQRQDDEQIELTLSKDDTLQDKKKSIRHKNQNDNSELFNMRMKSSGSVQLNDHKIQQVDRVKQTKNIEGIPKSNSKTKFTKNLNNEKSISQVIQAVSANEFQNAVNPQEVSSLMQNKILEITQRLGKLQFDYASLLNNNTRKFKQMSSQITGYHDYIKQQTRNIKLYENDIDKLRGELSQYKIKKQGQFMRMLSKLDKQDKQGIGTYFIDKLQFISKSMGELVNNDKYTEDISEINNHLQEIKKSLSRYASVQQLQTSVMMLDKKIEVFSKGKNKLKSNLQNDENNPESKVNANNTQFGFDADSQLISKIFSNQQKIAQASSIIQKIKLQLKQGKQFRRIYTQELQKKIKFLNEENDKTHFKLQSHETFLKDMNTSYNQKIAEATTNIIDVQEQLEKFSNQLKFYQHTSRSDTNASIAAHNSSIDIGSVKTTQIQNQLQNLKKKFNKLNLKTTSLKEELIQIGQVTTGRLAEFKIIVEDKADWQTLKKGMQFYQEKLKQVIQMLKHLNTNIDEQTKDQSIISKKKWTCLCCDKEVKAQEGKLQQLKFMSIYPSKYESPRIGGYYKQNITDRQYKALFMPNKRKFARSTGKQLQQPSQLFRP